VRCPSLSMAVLVSCLLHGGVVLIARVTGRALSQHSVLRAELVEQREEAPPVPDIRPAPPLRSEPPPARPPARPKVPPRRREGPGPAAPPLSRGTDREPPAPIAAPPRQAPLEPERTPAAAAAVSGTPAPVVVEAPAAGGGHAARVDAVDAGAAAKDTTGPPAGVEMGAAGPVASHGPGPGGGPSHAALAPGAPVPAAESGPDVTSWARPRGGYQVRPGYPAHVRRLGLQGVTLLRVHVLADGRVGDISVETSAGHPDLDRAAAEAVRQWRFEPGRRGDQAVAMWVLLPVEFRLR
jgi:periplasmic protein TonB